MTGCCLPRLRMTDTLWASAILKEGFSHCFLDSPSCISIIHRHLHSPSCLFCYPHLASIASYTADGALSIGGQVCIYEIWSCHVPPDRAGRPGQPGGGHLIPLPHDRIIIRLDRLLLAAVDDNTTAVIELPLPSPQRLSTQPGNPNGKPPLNKGQKDWLWYSFPLKYPKYGPKVQAGSQAWIGPRLVYPV